MKTFNVIKYAPGQFTTDITVNCKTIEDALQNAGAEKPVLVHRSMGLNLYVDKNNWQYGLVRIYEEVA